MAYQLIERPHKFSFSNNPVRYVFNISNPDTPGCGLDIELYTIAINGKLPTGELGTLITRQTLYPNPDGKVYFYCEDFLNSYLEWELPPLTNDNCLAVTKQIRKYYVRYRQITKGNPSPEWATDVEALRIAIKGGIAKEKFDRNNFFVNYLPAGKPFLTWQPAGHFIGTEERRYLSYFHHYDSTPDLILKARVVYVDGAQDTTEKALPSLSESLLYHLPAGLQQLGLYNLQPEKQVWYYDVSVEDGAGNIYAQPYRLYADYRMYYDVFSFIYTNSLGGIDTLRIRGDYDIEITRDFTEIQQATGGDFGTILPTENAVINISKYEVFKGDAGWLNTKVMQDSLQDLLLSDTVYRVVASRWLRVINLQKTQPLRSSDDTIWSFPLQWRYTFDNSQYTPFDVDFGSGTNNEEPGLIYGICTAPNNLSVKLTQDNGTEKQYLFTWSEVSGAEGSELQYKKPGAMDWIAIEATEPSLSLTLNDPGEYSWRVRTKCSIDDYSSFTNGTGFVLEITASSCTVPSGLGVFLMSLDSSQAQVKLNWDRKTTSNHFIVEWRELGASVWNQTNVYTSSMNPFPSQTVTVKKDNQYEWRVRTVCGANDYSSYMYGKNFIPSNLLGTCAVPTGLQALAYWHFTGDFVNFHFNILIDAASYEIQWREKGTTTWTIATATKSPYVTGAKKGKTFEWRMRSNCKGGGFSNFVNGYDFETPTTP